MTPSQKQFHRMLLMIPFLEANQGITLAEIAKKFGITEKRAKTEVEQLMLLGTGWQVDELIKLNLDALEGGSVEISNTKFVPEQLKFSQTERSALLLALHSLRQIANAEQTNAIDQVIGKLEQSLPQAVDIHVEDVNESVRLAVTGALEKNVRLEIVYTADGADAPAKLLVDPLRLKKEAGHLYLSAWSHKSQNHRFYRLDRIGHAATTSDPVDPSTYNQQIPDEFFADTAEPDVELLVDRDAWWIVEPCTHEVISKPDEWPRRVRVRNTGNAWLERLVLLAGGGIEVETPVELRESVRAAARAALAAYDELKFPN